MKEANPGDTVIAIADCPTFEDDTKKMCTHSRSKFLKLRIGGGCKKITIKA